MINNFNFEKNFKLANISSLFLVLASVFMIFFKGLNFGIDFKGGTLIELRCDSENIQISDVRASFNNLNLGDVNVKEFGKKGDYLIKFERKEFDGAIARLSSKITLGNRNNSSETVFENATVLHFADNKLLPLLYGEHDSHLARLEESFRIRISSRGNKVSLAGDETAVSLGIKSLNALYRRLEKGLLVNPAEVDATIRLVSDKRTLDRSKNDMNGDISIRTPRGLLTARSAGQIDYMQALGQDQMVFGVGPAGTGKTYLAVATAASMLVSGEVDRIILSRPAVEAGERLGFLPGDLREKIDPYLAPLYDALHDMLPADQVLNRFNSGHLIDEKGLGTKTWIS